MQNPNIGCLIGVGAIQFLPVGEQILVLSGSENRALDVLTLLKAQLLLWMLAATDGHAKNFSLLEGLEKSSRLLRQRAASAA